MNWMYSCKQVAELLTRRDDEPLGWLDRIRLRVHLSMCNNCRHVEQQLDGVRALTAELFANDLVLGGDEPADTVAPGNGPVSRTD